MRTKALLCAAALAAGTAISMAQNVYSLNVVGYINLALQPGYNLVANQLDADGTQTNNNLGAIFSTNLPTGSRVYQFDPASAGYNIATYNATSGKWIGASNLVNAALAPGKGVFVQVAGAAPVTVTLVGQVIQGTNTIALVPGLQIVSAIPPISAGIQTTLGYVPTVGDRVYSYVPASSGYSIHTYSGTKWIGGGGEPTPAVGEAFFLQSAATAPTSWTQVFSVQ